MEIVKILAVIASLVFGGPAEAHKACHHHAALSWNGLIDRLGGPQAPQLKSIYLHEDPNNCWVGDHGSSFGPFQLHYGGGLGDIFTRQTGLNARNRNTVPEQIAWMRRWGAYHGGFSSSIWHGLRGRSGHHRWHHWRHHHHRFG